MKLIVKTDKEIKSLNPRDIRNFLGSVVDDKIKDKVLWHKHLPPDLIYVKPFKKGFEIVSWKNDVALLNKIEKAIQNKNINIKGVNAKIIDTWYKDESLPLPKQGLYFYTTRTPIILSSNPIEYRIVYTTNTQNKKDLIKYIQERIKRDYIFRVKHYYNIDISNTLKDLNLIIQENDIKLVEVKEGEKKRQGAFVKMASNFTLPRFVGYAIGLGWGELIQQRI